MRERTKKLIEKIGLSEKDFQAKVSATPEELEEALIELAQNQADLEDAICELAEMIGGNE